MKVALKYSHALIAFALLVGQIQCVYTTYFCTDMHTPVSRPKVEMQSPEMSSGSTICDECRGVIPVQDGSTLSAPNCIQMSIHSKSVIGSFTMAEKAVSYYAASGIVSSRAPVEGNQLSAIGNLHFSFADSPPLPLHITNLNFRI